MPRRRPLRARPTPPGQGLEPAVSPGHGPEAACSRIARRGVLFGAPAALLAGCGMLGAGEEQAPTAGQGPAGEAGDRKSTRLNSSHVAISYAGFCLKKK